MQPRNHCSKQILDERGTNDTHSEHMKHTGKKSDRKPKTKHTSIRINPLVLDNGHKLAARERRTFNDWLQITLEKLWSDQVQRDSSGIR